MTAQPTYPGAEGVDLASVDGFSPDWAKVRGSGRVFAFWRASYRTSPDPAFPREWPRILAAGFVRGAYMFWYAKTDPLAQANAMIKAVPKLGPGELPPVFDLEFPGHRTSTGLTPRECIARADVALLRLREHYGVAPMLYSSRRIFTSSEELANAPFPSWWLTMPLWLARYSAQEPLAPPGWGVGNWWAQQYGESAPREVPGCSGTVDLDRFKWMKIGEAGARVGWAKRRLGMGGAELFDDAMLTRVRSFQRAHELTVDGVIGPRTFAVLAWERPGL